MGACCSKEGNYGDRQISNDENEMEQEDYVFKGECGASIRLQGSSDFISMATQQGRKGINQDAMTVWEDFTGENGSFFCGVFDGHGPCGHKVARNVRDQLPTKLTAAHKIIQAKGSGTSTDDTFYDDEDYAYANGEARAGEDTEDIAVFNYWKASLLRAYRKVDKELSLDSTIDSYCSGTTAVTVIKQGENLIIGNLGDSRAVMCSRGDKGQVIPVQLTVDLKPSLPREADRVRRCDGRVFALDEEPHVLRLWLPDEDSPGLAMTRAFGDFCLKDCGLVSIPQVFYRKLTEKDEFVVLATDGVWDVLTNFEVVKIVSSARTRSLAAKFLATHAVRAWKSRFPSSRTDDIAVICLFFKPPPLGKSGSDVSHITPADSLSHLNSSISQHTYRSLSTEPEEGHDNKDNLHKGKLPEVLIEEVDEGESLVNTSLYYPRNSNGRNRVR